MALARKTVVVLLTLENDHTYPLNKETAAELIRDGAIYFADGSYEIKGLQVFESRTEFLKAQILDALAVAADESG